MLREGSDGEAGVAPRTLPWPGRDGPPGQRRRVSVVHYVDVEEIKDKRLRKTKSKGKVSCGKTIVESDSEFHASETPSKPKGSLFVTRENCALKRPMEVCEGSTKHLWEHHSG